MDRFPSPDFYRNHDPAEWLGIAHRILGQISHYLKSPGTGHGDKAIHLIDTYISRELLGFFSRSGCHPLLSQLILDAIDGLQVPAVEHLLGSHPLHLDFQRELLLLALQIDNPLMASAMTSREQPSFSDEKIAEMVDLISNKILDLSARTSLVTNKMKLHQFPHRYRRTPEEATPLEWAIVGDELPQTALVLVKHGAGLSQQVPYTSRNQKFTFNLRDHLFILPRGLWITLGGSQYLHWLRKLWQAEVGRFGKGRTDTEWIASFERVIMSCHSHDNPGRDRKPKYWCYWSGSIRELEPERFLWAYTLFDIDILDQTWREGDMNGSRKALPRSLWLQSRMEAYKDIQKRDPLRQQEPMPQWATDSRQQAQQPAQLQLPPLRPMPRSSNPRPKDGRKATPSMSHSRAAVGPHNISYDSKGQGARRPQGPGNRR